MPKLTLDQWASIAQIIAVLVTSIGIIASMYFSYRALREVETDREHRHRPYLAFEYGGYRYPIRFAKVGKRIAGINPRFVEEMFPHLPADAESVWLDEPVNQDGAITPIRIGLIRNYGSGAALEVRVTWIPKKIRIGGEVFELDSGKRNEPLYQAELNTMPSIPQHLPPDTVGGLSRLPTFIDKDCDKKIREVHGVLEIRCMDSFGKSHLTSQEFHLFTSYEFGDERPYCHITFSSILPRGGPGCSSTWVAKR